MLLSDEVSCAIDLMTDATTVSFNRMRTNPPPSRGREVREEERREAMVRWGRASTALRGHHAGLGACQHVSIRKAHATRALAAVRLSSNEQCLYSTARRSVAKAHRRRIALRCTAQPQSGLVDTQVASCLACGSRAICRLVQPSHVCAAASCSAVPGEFQFQFAVMSSEHGRRVSKKFCVSTPLLCSGPHLSSAISTFSFDSLGSPVGILDTLCLVAFALELILRVGSYSWWVGPNAVLRDAWSLLDVYLVASHGVTTMATVRTR